MINYQVAQGVEKADAVVQGILEAAVNNAQPPKDPESGEYICLIKYNHVNDIMIFYNARRVFFKI